MLGIWAALLPRKTSESWTAIDPQSLAVWALQFSPRVALLEEAVLIEVGASARLFGGMEHLKARIEAEGTEVGAGSLGSSRRVFTPPARSSGQTPI